MIRRFILPFALLLAACAGREKAAPAIGTPVILISIDTLRSDHLPAYGYKGVQTPAIDALRRDSILFERAYSHYPLTLPSHATVFTGALPADTGIRDNTGYVLSDQRRTLAELLRAKGYATGAAVSTYVLRKGSGIERGFDGYDDDVGAISSTVNLSALQREGTKTVAAAETWLLANNVRPVFYFLHLYEPHTPYAAPEPYRSRYSPYDAEIARSDELVGRFLQSLKASGLYDRALIVLFSDHGEGLNDHGEEEHGIFLYRESLQVPLMVKLPGASRGGESVASPVQLSDIFPTVIEQTGLTMPAPGGTGAARSLLSAQPAGRLIYSESQFPRLHFGWSDLHSLISASHHYIQAPQPELYSTSDLPERNNVLLDNRRVFAAMRKEIAPLVREPGAPRAMDPEEAAKLAALGYLGSTAVVKGPLPDPKTKTSTFREIRKAFQLFQAARYEEALVLYRRLLAENPGMLDLWEISARSLVALGRLDQAMVSAKEALKLSPQSAHLALYIAALALQTGSLDDAQRHAELAVKSSPGEAHELLARVALARSDLDGAEREARAAVAVNTKSARALMTLGEVAHKRQQYAESLKLLDAAVKVTRDQKSPLAGLHDLRGDVLARLARPREAEQAFRDEIEQFPANPEPYKHLILLYVANGRAEEATQVVFALENASPVAPTYAAISETLRVVGDAGGAGFWARRGLAKFPGDATLQRLAAAAASPR